VVPGGGGDDPVAGVALAQAGQPPQGAPALERLDLRLVLALEVQLAAVGQARLVQRPQRRPGVTGGDELAGGQQVLARARGARLALRLLPPYQGATEDAYRRFEAGLGLLPGLDSS
jgi:hypothetical protein